jgi:hypothetical protein
VQEERRDRHAEEEAFLPPRPPPTLCVAPLPPHHLPPAPPQPLHRRCANAAHGRTHARTHARRHARRHGSTEVKGRRYEALRLPLPPPPPVAVPRSWFSARASSAASVWGHTRLRARIIRGGESRAYICASRGGGHMQARPRPPPSPVADLGRGAGPRDLLTRRFENPERWPSRAPPSLNKST